MAVEGPIYLAYHDKNEPSELFDFYKRHRPDTLKNIDYDVYGATNVNDYLNKLLGFAENGCRYIGVITDSATKLTSNAVNWSLGFKSKDDRNRNNEPKKLIPDFDEYKIETSMVTQALDACSKIPAHMIWTCHPLPQMRIEQSGKRITVTRETSIVTYGSKAAAMISSAFNEVYHFAKELDYSTNPTTERRLVLTSNAGEDFVRTTLGLPSVLDITNKLFWEVWKEALANKSYGGAEMPVKPY